MFYLKIIATCINTLVLIVLIVWIIKFFTRDKKVSRFRYLSSPFEGKDYETTFYDIKSLIDISRKPDDKKLVLFYNGFQKDIVFLDKGSRDDAYFDIREAMGNLEY